MNEIIEIRRKYLPVVNLFLIGNKNPRNVQQKGNIELIVAKTKGDSRYSF